MTRMPWNQQQNPTPAPWPEPPHREPPRWRCRWGILAVIAAIALAAFVMNHVEPNISWSEIMDAVRVPASSHTKYSRNVVLGMVIVGTLLVIRALRSTRED